VLPIMETPPAITKRFQLWKCAQIMFLKVWEKRESGS
jgi:hypothetical protein